MSIITQYGTPTARARIAPACAIGKNFNGLLHVTSLLLLVSLLAATPAAFAKSNSQEPLVYQNSEPWPKDFFSEAAKSRQYRRTGNIWVSVGKYGNINTAANNKTVQQHMAWYQKNSRYLERVFNRAEPYIHFIVSELRARNLPLAFALIPIVESAYDPFAFSHGTAAGLWQIMPATATHLGVEQNWWYDGRRDLYDSTIAALNYLEYLGKFFDGDWHLALAAYNAGEGTVQRAMRRNKQAGKPTDFWSLRLPRETQQYVPKILALAELLKKPEAAGIILPNTLDIAIVDYVELDQQIDLSIAARMANLSLGELYRLNPGYNHWATAPDGPHRLFLPIHKVNEFKQQIASLPPEERLNWMRYTIESGDSLSTIALRHKTSVQVLQTLNDLDSHRINAGQHILIPTTATDTHDYVLNLADLNVPNAYYNEQEVIYTVKPGDSLWKVAKSHQVRIADLMLWNNLSAQQHILPGQKLKIWQNVPAAQMNGQRPEIVRKVNYRARRGDSVAKIASRFKVSNSDIEKWNGLAPGHILQPGENLIVYVDVTKQSA
jgi:membrane-bound lytic murein transglycosylase D